MDVAPPVLLDRGGGGCGDLDPSSSAPICYAFYSSYLGGVTRDPTLAAVPIDDHGFHRGHCVFDTANVTVSGRVYALEQHLDRIALSAGQAGILMPSRQSLRAAVLGTVAAGGRQPGGRCSFIRYWLTSGRGDFSISPAGCDAGPGFFVVVHDDSHSLEIPTATVAAVTSSVPLKPSLLSTMKTNNYLLNALVAMDAEARGADFGIQMDERGCITESSVSTVGIVVGSDEGGGGGYGDDLVFVVPPFDQILASTTVKRALALMPSTVQVPGGQTRNVRVEQRDISSKELFAAREVIDFGGHFCRPVGSIDGLKVGAGPYPVYEAVASALCQDMAANESMLDDVSYDDYL